MRETTTRAVPAQSLRPGDRLVTPAGRPLTVERVDRAMNGALVVRWTRALEPEQTFDGAGGRLHGSWAPLDPDELVELAGRERDA